MTNQPRLTMEELERLTPDEVEHRIQLAEIEKTWGRAPITDFTALTKAGIALRLDGKPLEVSVSSYEVHCLMQDVRVQMHGEVAEGHPNPHAMKIGSIVIIERVCIDGVVADYPPPQPPPKLEYSDKHHREMLGEWAPMPERCAPGECRVDAVHRKPTCRRCGHDMGGE